jgi:hypothetical protein
VNTLDTRSVSVLSPSLEGSNQNHRHYGVGALWLRQAELSEHVLTDLEGFLEGPASYDDDEQDLYHYGVQDQAVLSEEEGE